MDYCGSRGVSFVGRLSSSRRFNNGLLPWERGPEVCPLLRGCPFLGGSFIGGSTVEQINEPFKLVHLQTMVPFIECLFLRKYPNKHVKSITLRLPLYRQRASSFLICTSGKYSKSCSDVTESSAPASQEKFTCHKASIASD